MWAGLFQNDKNHTDYFQTRRKTKLASGCTICSLITCLHVSTVSSGLQSRHLWTCDWWTEDVGDLQRQPLSRSSDEDFIKELSGWKVGRLLALFLPFLSLWRALMERASLWASGELRVGMPASPVTVEGRFNLPFHHRRRAFYLYFFVFFMAASLLRREDYTGDKQVFFSYIYNGLPFITSTSKPNGSTGPPPYQRTSNISAARPSDD